MCACIPLLSLSTCIHMAAMSGETDKVDCTGLTHLKIISTNLTRVSSAPRQLHSPALFADSAVPSLFSNLQPMHSGKNLTYYPPHSSLGTRVPTMSSRPYLHKSRPSDQPLSTCIHSSSYSHLLPETCMMPSTGSFPPSENSIQDP